jgi:hypothetical protein
MSIESELYEKLIQECDKLTRRHHKYHNRLEAEWVRAKKRARDTPPKVVRTPEYWDADRKFNPFYVHANAAAIARSIARKISDGTYAPNPPFTKTIPKTHGGFRQLTIYQIPDAAVSNYFYARLLAKNRHRFSSFSYAYRNDRNVHFAIQDIAVDLSLDSRAFIAEFDFSDFFGSIDHSFLYAQLHRNGFLVSDEDERVIRSFLKGRDRGIPQGTSISLFLANLVCWTLDKSFERNGLKFARYADDTVVWSSDYAAICKAFTLIEVFSRDAGVPINPIKSAGISLLKKRGLRSEIASKDSFDFLGYSLGVEHVSMSEKAEKKIKKQLSFLLYKNLVQPLKTRPLRSLMIPSGGRDEALLTAMLQIRRYLYGRLEQRDIVEYLKGRRRTLYFKGAMSFYPLVDDESQLRALDGWLLSTIARTLRLRAKLLLSHGFDRRAEFPFNVSRGDIPEEFRRKRIDGKRLLEPPSFMLVYRAIQRGLKDTGIERVMHPESSKYAYRDA